MSMLNQNFSMFAGDTKNLNFTITLTGTIVGSTVVWGLIKDGVVVLQKSTANGGGITITGAGAFTVLLSPNDTVNLAPGTYSHEAESTDGSGNVATLAAGECTLLASYI